MARTKVIFMIMVLVIVVIGGLFWHRYWIPEKHTVQIEELERDGHYILIKEAYHTGTGWEVVGDRNGYYEGKEKKDIILSGKKLPISEIGHNINIFVCLVEYKGQKEHVAFEELIESYNVIEWYPVYPVVRNSIWPSWMLPKKFMNKQDLSGY